jgi:DNA-binding CsgD family transcriptional regulator
MICDGMTNPQIAEILNLSTETINWYRKRLLAKFGVKNAVSLATLVMREKII